MILAPFVTVDVGNFLEGDTEKPSPCLNRTIVVESECKLGDIRWVTTVRAFVVSSCSFSRFLNYSSMFFGC